MIYSYRSASFFIHGIESISRVQESGVQRRQLQFHEDEPTSNVASRHCALWNPDIGLSGAWDTAHIQTVQANQFAASCITDR
jgi:hypothetical protein